MLTRSTAGFNHASANAARPFSEATTENAMSYRRVTSGSAIVLAAALQLLLVSSRTALAADAGPADWSKSELTSISLTNFAFAPQQITFEHGTAYRLHFVNDSSSNHNFSAPELFDAVTIAPDDRSKVVD